MRPGGHVFVSTLNRTPKAYALAIVGAEYVLRLLPTGTHTYEKFIKPSELRRWSRAAGLSVVDIAGLDYDPFARKATADDATPASTTSCTCGATRRNRRRSA